MFNSSSVCLELQNRDGEDLLKTLRECSEMFREDEETPHFHPEMKICPERREYSTKRIYILH